MAGHLNLFYIFSFSFWRKTINYCGLLQEIKHILKTAPILHTNMHIRYKLPYFTLLCARIYQDRSFFLYLTLGKINISDVFDPIKNLAAGFTVLTDICL